MSVLMAYIIYAGSVAILCFLTARVVLDFPKKAIRSAFIIVTILSLAGWYAILYGFYR